MISKKIIKAIRKIEKVAYPKHIRNMEDIKTESDLFDYCESGIIKVVQESHFYCIMAKHYKTCEIVDLASKDGLTRSDMVRIIDAFKEFDTRYKFDEITCEMRTTSYHLRSIFPELGFDIVTDKKYHDWDFDEIMATVIARRK